MAEFTKITGASEFERPKHPNCVMARIAEVSHTAQTTRMVFENGHLIMVDIDWADSPLPGDVLVIGATHVFLWERSAVPLAIHARFDKERSTSA